MRTGASVMREKYKKINKFLEILKYSENLHIPLKIKEI
jgi:hypothetical protein